MLCLTCNAAIFTFSLFLTCPIKTKTNSNLNHGPDALPEKESFTVYRVWIRTPGKHVNLIVPSFHFISYPMYWIQVKQYKKADVSYDVFFLVIKHNKGRMSLWLTHCL